MRQINKQFVVFAVVASTLMLLFAVFFKTEGLYRGYLIVDFAFSSFVAAFVLRYESKNFIDTNRSISSRYGLELRDRDQDGPILQLIVPFFGLFFVFVFLDIIISSLLFTASQTTLYHGLLKLAFFVISQFIGLGAVYFFAEASTKLLLRELFSTYRAVFGPSSAANYLSPLLPPPTTDVNLPPSTAPATGV